MKQGKKQKITSRDEPMVIYVGLLSVVACVPAGWTDEQVERFARREPCGTTGGWRMHEALAGTPGRVTCTGKDAREGFVHVMLYC